ncbi:MAG: sugar ABC transporter permease [Anaerolineales bacterium]|nr:sugar ABC transporter permease [Anaerolineales bacterium]
MNQANRNLIKLYLIPPLIFLFIITIYPFIFSFYQSLHDWLLYKPQRTPPFVGLKQFITIFTDKDFWMALERSLIFLILVVFCSIIFGLLQALVLSNDNIKGKNVIRSLLIVPLVISPVVVGFAFRFMLNTDLGVIPWFLDQIGIHVPRILGDPKIALYAVILVDIWNQTPIAFLVLLASIQSINPELYEVAAIDGGSYFQCFRYVTLPLIKRSIIVILIILSIDAFKAFDIMYVMTEGGPGRSTELMSLYGYRIAFISWRMGTASAFALILFYIIVGITTYFMRHTQGVSIND